VRLHPDLGVNTSRRFGRDRGRAERGLKSCARALPERGAGARCPCEVCRRSCLWGRPRGVGKFHRVVQDPARMGSHLKRPTPSHVLLTGPQGPWERRTAILQALTQPAQVRARLCARRSPDRCFSTGPAPSSTNAAMDSSPLAFADSSWRCSRRKECWGEDVRFSPLRAVALVPNPVASRDCSTCACDSRRCKKSGFCNGFPVSHAIGGAPAGTSPWTLPRRPKMISGNLALLGHADAIPSSGPAPRPLFLKEWSNLDSQRFANVPKRDDGWVALA
jgi:hypothetical protein